MGKNGGIFKDLRLSNRASARLARKDLNSDFKVTQAGLDAITQNLLTTQGSLGTALSGTNARALEAMGRITQKDAAKLEQIVSQGRNAVHSRYGAAIAGIPGLFKGAETIQRTQGNVNRGALNAGELQARGANEAMDILSTAAQGAASSASWELAQALSGRSNEVELAIAEARAALAQQRLEFQQEKKLLALQNKMAGGSTGYQAAAQAIQDAYADDASASEIANMVEAAKYQFNLGPAEMQRLRNMANALAGGASTTSTSSSAYPEGAAFRADTGQSPSSYLGSTVTGNLNRATWEWYDPGKAMPTYNEALAIGDIVHDGEGNLAVELKVDDGMGGKTTTLNPVTQEYADAVVAYVQSTYRRIEESKTTSTSTPKPKTTPKTGTATDTVEITPSGTRIGPRGGQASPPPEETYQQGGNTYDRTTGYVVPEGGEGKGVPAPVDGSAFGTTKSGRKFIYKGGHPFYQDTGYLVPEVDLPDDQPTA